jgi:hypothetical protein
MLCAAWPFIATGAAAGIAQHAWVPTHEEQKRENDEQRTGGKSKDSIPNFLGPLFQLKITAYTITNLFSCGLSREKHRGRENLGRKRKMKMRRGKGDEGILILFNRPII